MTPLSIWRKGCKERKLKMKKLMVVLGCAAMVALAGCKTRTAFYAVTTRHGCRSKLLQ